MTEDSARFDPTTTTSLSRGKRRRGKCDDLDPIFGCGSLDADEPLFPIGLGDEEQAI